MIFRTVVGGWAAALCLMCCAAASAQMPFPRHPYAAQSPWPFGFGGTHNQQSIPFAGPRPGDSLAIEFVGRDARAPMPSGLVYSSPYAPGIYNTYGTNSREIWKIVRTPTSIYKADFRVERLWTREEGLRFTSGYWVPDGQQGAYFLIGDSLVHFVDARSGDPRSPIAERARLDISSALSRRRDVALGLVRLHSGALVFTTRAGQVCATDSDLASGPVTCVEVGGGTKEEVRNNIAAEPGPHGADDLYVTTTTAVVKLRFDPRSRQFQTIWRADVPDTGSSPTLMGAPGDPDKLVVVTSFPPRGQGDRYELIAIWRDDRTPLGKNRIAGRISVTFGLDGSQRRDIRPTQNSLPVSGYRTVVANFNGIFTYAEPVSASALGAQAFDWDTARGSWREVWLNRDVYIPNSMLAIAAPPAQRAIVYAIGLRAFAESQAPPRRRIRLRQPSEAEAPIWTLEALDLATGVRVAQWDVGKGPQWNLNGSGVQIGPDREILTSGSQGVYRLRPTMP